MALHNMLPPAGGATITVSGRRYQAADSVVVGNVPDFDADILEANGWTKAAKDGATTTVARPTNPTKNARIHDTTLGITIQWDGKKWINPLTGAIV